MNKKKSIRKENNTTMDVDQWEIVDDMGTVIAGDRDWIITRWELMEGGRMPIKTLGEVKLIKVIKILRPVL